MMKTFGIMFGLCFALVACAAVLATPPVTSAEAQLACVAEAGTAVEGEACMCNVRAKYPAGPQCDAGAR